MISTSGMPFQIVWDFDDVTNPLIFLGLEVIVDVEFHPLKTNVIQGSDGIFCLVSL